MKKKYIKIVFCIYILLLLIFVVFKFNSSFYDIQDKIQTIQWNRKLGNYNYNLTLFKSIKTQLTHISNLWAFKNLIGNIIVYIPLGFLIPLVFPKLSNLTKVLLVCFFIISIMEITQFLTMLGSFDVDDIFLNSLGCIIGYECNKKEIYHIKR